MADKIFYADIVRGKRVALLAGPFRSEEIARKYSRPASLAASEVDPWAAFDSFGVVGVDPGAWARPGKVNHLIEIDPGDLMSEEELRAMRARI